MNTKPRRKTAGNNEALMVALACGATVETAAAKANLGERTVYRRLEDPAFRQQLHEFRASMVERSSAMMTAASMEAVKTLLGLMERSIPHAIRLGAARAVIELGVKMRDLHEVEQRLGALEKSTMVKASKNKLS